MPQRNFTLSDLDIAMLFVQRYHLPIRLGVEIAHHAFLISTFERPSQQHTTRASTLVLRQGYELVEHVALLALQHLCAHSLDSTACIIAESQIHPTRRLATECTAGFWRRLILGQNPVGPCDHGSCPATVVRVLIDDFEMYILRSFLLDLREDGGVLRAEIVANGVGGGGAELVFHKRSYGGGVDGRYGGTIREVTNGDRKRHGVWCEGSGSEDSAES